MVPFNSAFTVLPYLMNDFRDVKTAKSVHNEPVSFLVNIYLFYSFTVYSFDGLIVFGLLMVCTCAYMKRVPKLKQWFLSEKKGLMGVFYKGNV